MVYTWKEFFSQVDGQSSVGVIRARLFEQALTQSIRANTSSLSSRPHLFSKWIDIKVKLSLLTLSNSTKWLHSRSVSTITEELRLQYRCFVQNRCRVRVLQRRLRRSE